MPLNPYFHGHDEPHGRAVLIWQGLAVEADGENGKRVAGFVETQTLHIGPRHRLED